MIKVFISQPMRDKTNEHIMEEKETTLEHLKTLYPDQEIEIIDSFFKNESDEAKRLWFLNKNLELLSTAEVAYFCREWYIDSGCRLEHLYAEAYAIQITHYDD